QLILERLEAFVARVKAGLEAADWQTRRELIRTLVKRVEIDQERVSVVFRVGPLTPELPEEKESQSLQHCGRRNHPALWYTGRTGEQFPTIHNPRLEPGFDDPAELREGLEFGKQCRMVNVVERTHNLLPHSRTQ